MTRQLEKDSKAMAKTASVADTRAAEITELQSKVLEAGGTRLKQAKARAEAAGAQLDEAVRRVVTFGCGP
jgi:hypothetical protein